MNFINKPAGCRGENTPAGAAAYVFWGGHKWRIRTISELNDLTGRRLAQKFESEGVDPVIS